MNLTNFPTPDVISPSISRPEFSCGLNSTTYPLPVSKSRAIIGRSLHRFHDRLAAISNGLYGRCIGPQTRGSAAAVGVITRQTRSPVYAPEASASLDWQ